MLLELAGENLRNLGSFELEPGPGLNVIVGRNAAGKTSLLEAIHLLSLGRSFRSARLDEVVRLGSNRGWVRGRVRERESGAITRLGLARSAGRTLCRIDGETVSSAAELARRLPVQIMHPESHRLLSGAPAHRRAFLDWGCFYQADGFFSAWTRFRRALQQRNAALKSGSDPRTLAALEHEFSICSDIVDQARSAYVDALIESLDDFESLWPERNDCVFEYRRGWGKERPLVETLAAEREQARRVGHTLAGPHRAELLIKSNGERVAQVFSRGQLKRAAAALLLAQTAAFERATGRDVLVLVDDLPSELDSQARETFLSILVERRRQCFVTALSRNDLTTSGEAETRMFHVEHGRLAELV